jgi:Gpi18-like mannosyltransferase
MVWFFNFLLWFDKNIDPVVQFPHGFILIIKLFAIIADLFISITIFKLAKNHHAKFLYLWPSLYLFSPFSFYLSALWGQYDQISYFFVLLSLLLIKSTAISPLLIAISLNLKPTSAVFIPLYLFLFIKTKPQIRSLLVGAFLSITLTVWSLYQFTNNHPLLFVKNQLVRSILYKSEYRVTNNSYNFWHIFTGDIGHNQNEIFFALPYKTWSWLIFIILNFLATKQLKKITPASTISALYIVGAGSWLFLTNMLERYYFSGITTALLVSIFYPSTLKFFLISSLIYFFNLYRGWWFPSFLEFLRPLLTGPHLFTGLPLSLLNLFLYLFTLAKINRHET